MTPNPAVSCSITQDLTRPVTGDDLVIVEDIIDTGLTISYLREQLKGRNPASVKVAALLHKPARIQREVEIDYLGFTIDDVFVVGLWARLRRALPQLALPGCARPIPSGAPSSRRLARRAGAKPVIGRCSPDIGSDTMMRLRLGLSVLGLAGLAACGGRAIGDPDPGSGGSEPSAPAPSSTAKGGAGSSSNSGTTPLPSQPLGACKPWLRPRSESHASVPLADRLGHLFR